MKKILFNIILIIMTFMTMCFTFVGCNNSSYEIVSSVEFVTDGKKKTMSSFASLVDNGQLYSRESSSRTEYEMAEKKYRFSSFYMYSNDVKLGYSGTINSFHGLTEEDYGRYVYWGEYPLMGEDDKYLYYYKQRFYGWEYTYLYVKVIDNKTIAFYDSNTDESNATTYSVTSFKITRFYH